MRFADIERAKDNRLNMTSHAFAVIAMLGLLLQTFQTPKMPADVWIFAVDRDKETFIIEPIVRVDYGERAGTIPSLNEPVTSAKPAEADFDAIEAVTRTATESVYSLEGRRSELGRLWAGRLKAGTAVVGFFRARFPTPRLRLFLGLLPPRQVRSRATLRTVARQRLRKPGFSEDSRRNGSPIMVSTKSC